MSYHLINLVQTLGTPRILVLGDLILDQYLLGQTSRLNREAPVVLLNQQPPEFRLGGAANVANMLQKLNAQVSLIGLVGDDEEGELICRELQASGINTRSVLIDAARPTTTKQRIMGQSAPLQLQQLLQLERESRAPLSVLQATFLLDRLIPEIPRHDALLISDYGRGVCTAEVLQRAIEIAKHAGIPVLIDPAFQDDYSRYAGATLLKPNRHEAARATGMEIQTAEQALKAGRVLLERLELQQVIITLDQQGLVSLHSTGEELVLPTRKRDIRDSVGAGDFVFALLGLGTTADWPREQLGQIANCGGGLEVEQLGVTCFTRDELVADLLSETSDTDEKICSWEVASSHLRARKQIGQKIVFTNGCFDVLHIGHVSYLKEAARLGDCLVVALNSDSSIRQLGKGADRPIFSVEQRAEMLSALECVDYVVVFEESTPHQVLESLRPDLLVKGGDYSWEQITGREIVLGYGGEVKILAERPGVSSTNILARLHGTASTIPIPQSAGPVTKKAG